MRELQKRDDGVQPGRLGQEGAQQHVGPDTADHAEHRVQRDVAQAQAPEADAPQKDEQAHAQAVADAADKLKRNLKRWIHVAAGDDAEGAGTKEDHGGDDRPIGAKGRMHAIVEEGAAEQHGGRRRAEGVAHEAGHDTRPLVAAEHHVEGEQEHEAQAHRLAVYLAQVALVGRLHAKAHLWYTKRHPSSPRPAVHAALRAWRSCRHALYPQHILLECPNHANIFKMSHVPAIMVQPIITQTQSSRLV